MYGLGCDFILGTCIFLLEVGNNKLGYRQAQGRLTRDTLAYLYQTEVSLYWLIP